MMTLTIFVVVLLCIGDLIESSDPCITHEVLTENARAANIKIDLASDYPFSDDRLNLRWYKIENDVGDEMATEPPGTFMCTTWYPIWLNGTLPKQVNQTTTQQACLQSFENICERTWTIRIKRCPADFFVYELPPSPIIDSGYCFGYADSCSAGESSETGKEPGCSSDYPHLDPGPFIESLLTEGVTTDSILGPSLLPTFQCSMNIIQSYVYDVYWFIDDFSVLTLKNRASNELPSTQLLPHHWVELHKMNMKVKCAVRLRNERQGVPSPLHYSNEYTAGLIVVNDVPPNLVMYEGEEKTVQLRSTVPVGCVGSNIQSQCNIKLHVAVETQNSNQCSNGVRQGSLAIQTQSCGLPIPSKGWNNTLELRVSGFVDSVYNLNSSRTAIISLFTIKSDQDTSGIWNNLRLMDIEVHVYDADRLFAGNVGLVLGEASLVSIFNQHFSFQGIGEFVLFRQNLSDIEIHILKTASLRGTGVCGIAIRSRKSLFVMRTCSSISHKYLPPSTFFVPVIEYTKYDDTDMVVQKFPEKFNVILPTGTEVQFSFKRFWLNHISLKPSVLDNKNVSGLLSYVPESNLQEFIKINRISKDSQKRFFVGKQSFRDSNFSKRTYCECKQGTGQMNAGQCNLTQPTNVMPCNGNTNNEDVASIPEQYPLMYNDSVDSSLITQNYEWPQGWTPDRAKIYCEEAIFNNDAYKICKQYTQMNFNVLVASCQADINIVGDTYIWSEDVLKEVCFIESTKNETMHVTKTSSGESLIDVVLKSLCPNNCNGNGACVKGRCSCNDNYIGSACAVRKSDAPKDISVLKNGLCNTHVQACDDILVFGDFTSTEVYCQLSKFTIRSEGLVRSQTMEIFPAVYESRYSISCPFPPERRKRSVGELAYGYKLSLSYNQVNFGDQVNIIIYDEGCVTCNYESLRCTDLNQCFTSSTTQQTSTFIDGNTFGTRKEKAGILALLFGLSLLCFLLILGIAWTVYRNKRKRIRREPYVLNEEKQVPNLVYSISEDKGKYEGDPPPPYWYMGRKQDDVCLSKKKIDELFIAKQ